LKEYIIYAGVNGSGKSTLYNLHDQKHIARVNPDEILTAAIKAGNVDAGTAFAMRQSVKMIKDFLSREVSFCQETTLSGKTIFGHIREAKARGYKITMYYVGVETADIAVARVADRVRRGGHDIPESDIRRRFDVSAKNLITAVSLCDEIGVYDNTEFFKPIAFFYNGSYITSNDNNVSWFEKIFPRK
jgi:predicted ABC-type ATPase